MTNYNNGKIYKIEPTCAHDEGHIYIGSTTKQYLCQRMGLHKCQYKKYKKGLFHKLTSFDIFDIYGVDNVKIVLIESVNANSKEELTSKEAEYIRNTNCINKYIPNRTKSEYKQDNKEKIKADNKKYYQENKDKINEKKKEYAVKYRENNKEMINEKKRIYRANQKLKKTMEI